MSITTNYSGKLPICLVNGSPFRKRTEQYNTKREFLIHTIRLLLLYKLLLKPVENNTFILDVCSSDRLDSK